MKVVILGSRRVLEPFKLLYVPKTQESEQKAKELCQEAIKQADEVWICLDKAGKHTYEDLLFAIEQNKVCKVIKDENRTPQTEVSRRI